MRKYEGSTNPEDRSVTGSASGNRGGFSASHTRELVANIVRIAEGRELHRRAFSYRVDQAISILWKYGITTKIGNVTRQIMPEELCPKLKFLGDHSENFRSLTSLEYRILAKTVQFVAPNCRHFDKAASKKPRHIPWFSIRTINAAYKRLKTEADKTPAE